MKFDFVSPEQIGTLSPEYFVIFRDYIAERTGIRVRDSRLDYLEYRIQERMIINNISDYREYYYLVKYDAAIIGEMQQLINLITVHETSFFRHPEQLETLSNLILKRVVDKKIKEGDCRLRFWSAACSTGEEPLTLAMMLREDYPELVNDWAVTIFATDLSTEAIKKARQGLYGENSFRSADVARYQQKYFLKMDGKYKVNSDLKSMISYRNANLTDMYSLNQYQGVDVILCRNVFIYFPDDVKEKISRKFYELLAPGGALILGNAENVDVKKIPFKLEFHKGGPVYVKQ